MYAARHVDQSWYSIPIHACGSVPIAMVPRLVALGIGPPELRYDEIVLQEDQGLRRFVQQGP